MKLILSNILGWFLENWLPALIAAVVVGGFLWVNGLRSTIRDQEAQISSLETRAENSEREAVRQASAFKTLEQTFQDYMRIVDDYMKEIEANQTKVVENQGAVKDSGTDSDRNAPVDPYTREVLEKLCKLNPDYCDSPTL